MLKKHILFLLLGFLSLTSYGQKADISIYLESIKVELQKKWPNNRTVNLIYHGHSVPSGYYTQGVVNTFGSYPFLALKSLKEKYRYAVINTILTSIGGEQSEK